MQEEWKSVKGYEMFYECSTKGKIRKKKRYIDVVDEKQKRVYKKTVSSGLIKQFVDNNGYMVVNILGKRTRVHRIIAKTFIDNPLNKYTVNHKDMDKKNNNVDNLEWMTIKENNIHGMINNKNRKQRDNGVHVLMCDIRSREVIKMFYSIMDAYQYFGKKYQGGISQVCSGKRKKCMGYWWKYEK